MKYDFKQPKISFKSLKIGDIFLSDINRNFLYKKLDDYFYESIKTINLLYSWHHSMRQKHLIFREYEDKPIFIKVNRIMIKL